MEQALSTPVNFLPVKTTQLERICHKPTTGFVLCHTYLQNHVCVNLPSFFHKSHASVISHINLVMCPMTNPFEICQLCWVHSAKRCLQLLLLSIKKLSLSRPCCSQFCCLHGWLVFSTNLGYSLLTGRKPPYLGWG